MADVPTVLLVDDNDRLADLFATWLEEDYTVKIAYSGEQALEKIDETIDVILLDRQMPELSGDAVLAELRQREITCQVVMVTVLEPEADILDLGYDEYLTKPVSRDDVLTVVETLLKRSAYDDGVQEYYRLLSKQIALRAEMDRSELLDHPKYRALETEIEAIETKLEKRTDDFNKDDFKAQLRKISRVGGGTCDTSDD